MTLRTFEYLLATSLATRPNDGSLTSAELRDVVESISGCKGGLLTNLGASQIVSAALTYVDVKPFVLDQLGTRNLTLDKTLGTITTVASGSGLYRVGFDFCLRRDNHTSGTDPRAFVKLLVDGAEACTAVANLAADLDIAMFSAHTFIPIADLKVIKAQFAVIDAFAMTVTLLYGNITVERVGKST